MKTDLLYNYYKPITPQYYLLRRAHSTQNPTHYKENIQLRQINKSAVQYLGLDILQII